MHFPDIKHILKLKIVVLLCLGPFVLTEISNIKLQITTLLKASLKVRVFYFSVA